MAGLWRAQVLSTVARFGRSLAGSNEHSEPQPVVVTAGAGKAGMDIGDDGGRRRLSGVMANGDAGALGSNG